MSTPDLPRHCWVVNLPDAPGRWPGLLTAWRRHPDGGWEGNVTYVVTDHGRAVLLQTWVVAANLLPT